MIELLPQRFFAFLLFGLFACLVAHAQEQELELAAEYHQNKEYDKVVSILDKHIKNDSYLPQIHAIYLEALYQTQDVKQAEKYLKRLVKKFPSSVVYNVDYGKYLQNHVDSAAAAAHLNAYFNLIKQDSRQLRYAAVHFKDARMFEYAERVYLFSRKNEGEGFYYEMAELYLLWGKTDKMIDEYLSLLLLNEQQLEYVQSALQDNIDEKDAPLLERKLMQAIQKSPNQLVLNELLTWFYLQRKEFYKAFMQARAIDKRRGMNGSKIMSIGYMALNNAAYKDAVRIFEYVTEQYQTERGLYQTAKRLLISAKAELVKNTYPVDKEKIQSLVVDYETMIEQVGWGREAAEAVRSMALLRAFYLNERQEAIKALERLIEIPMLPRLVISEAKLDLADIYLLHGEPWEASLLYSQVEKAEKDKPLGHSAKLKNAKVHYYNGDFQLAKSHLDILKLATSREIANDAMKLSLLIDDNLALDTSTVAMQSYATIDLLVFQGKYQEAITAYEAMLKTYTKHSLADEILWEQANLLLKLGRHEEAIRALEILLEKHGEDILADDANFLLGTIYEEHLKDAERAMEYYQSHLLLYKGSVHTEEARKRFRRLRGDKI